MAEHLQFQIESIESQEDRQEITRHLSYLAGRLNWIDATVTSRVPNTLCGFGEPDGASFIGARWNSHVILVDFVSKGERTGVFADALEEMSTLLPQVFPYRVRFVDASEVIPAVNTRPPGSWQRVGQRWINHR